MDNDTEKQTDWKNIFLLKWGIPCSPTKEKTKKSVKAEREKILDKICRPKEWWRAGKLWIQHLSAEPAKRMEVIKLGEELDFVLNEHSIRDTGICDIRHHIYKQLFSELTRQITLYCVQQGSLLVQIRDEIWMMHDFYEKMYENSIAFTSRKTVEGEERRQQLEYLLENLKLKKENKENEINVLRKILKEKEIIMNTCRQKAEVKDNEVIQRHENSKTTQKIEQLNYLQFFGFVSLIQPVIFFIVIIFCMSVLVYAPVMLKVKKHLQKVLETVVTVKGK